MFCDKFTILPRKCHSIIFIYFRIICNICLHKYLETKHLKQSKAQIRRNILYNTTTCLIPDTLR